MPRFKCAVKVAFRLWLYYLLFVYRRKSGCAGSMFCFPYNSDCWADSFQIWQVYTVALGNLLEYAVVIFRPIREVT